MNSSEDRRTEIKSRLATLVDLKSLPPSEALQRQRRRSFGQAMLVLGGLILVAGLYLPSGDSVGRAIFIGAGLLHAGLGAWSIDRANRHY